MPTTYKQAVARPDGEDWDVASKEEYLAMLDNDVWELVPLSQVPQHSNLIKCRWVYRIKYNSDGSIERYKARICAKGFQQKEGIDFEETFAPVARVTSMRILFALAVRMNWEIHHTDVKTAFLNAFLDETVYMEQPEGFEQTGPNGEKMVCRLKRAVYGLKQAPRNWNEELTKFMTQYGFVQSKVDNCIFTLNKSDGTKLIVLVYVDDLITTGNSPEETKTFLQALGSKFKTTNKGELEFYNGIQFTRNRSKKTGMMHQEKYINDTLEEMKMTDAKPKFTPIQTGMNLSVDETSDYTGNLNEFIRQYRKIIGKLLWIALCTRPDIQESVSKLAGALHRPSVRHWEAAKRVLRYLKATKHKGLKYNGNEDIEIFGFSDSDWAGSFKARKSTTGWVFMMFGAAVSWCSKLQLSVALSSTEAEYMALSSATQEVIYLRALLKDLGFTQTNPTIMGVDNQGCRMLANNPVFHKRSKHIEIRYHFIREKIKHKEIETVYIPTDEMLADILTKTLGRVKHCYFTDRILGLFQ